MADKVDVDLQTPTTALDIRGKGRGRGDGTHLGGKLSREKSLFRLRFCVRVCHGHVIHSVQQVPLHHSLGEVNEARGPRMKNSLVKLPIVFGSKGIASLLC